METMDVQTGSAGTAKARKRVPNFTADEKGLLASMVKKRPIVESKQTDGKSVEKKKLAWESITTEFNSHNHVYKRDTLTLKRAWDNMKAMTRKARADERGNLIKTGGGPSIPPQPPQQGAIINMVEEAAPAIVCEIVNSYDSDGAILSKIHTVKKLSQDQEGKILYRLGFTKEDEENPLPVRTTLTNPVRMQDLPRLYAERLKIKKSEHLQQLKMVMEADYHPFYDTIPHE